MRKKLVLDLAAVIDSADITQKELSEMTGLTTQTISNMVRGSSQVRLDSLTKICYALNLEPYDLIVWQVENGNERK